MTTRGGKQQVKSPIERKYYGKAIREQEYQPTINEDFKFFESDNLNDSPDVEDIPKRRPISLKDRLSDYWDNNGLATIIGLIITGVIFVVGYFIFDINKGITTIQVKQDGNTEQIKEIKEETKEISEEVDQLKMDVQKNTLKIEFNEKSINEKK